MKKEMKVLAIVLAAFALVLCLASCNPDPSKDFRFSTFIINLGNANGDPSKMPKIPNYCNMSPNQLQKFNHDWKNFILPIPEPFAYVDANKARFDEDGNFIIGPDLAALKQDKNGNWSYQTTVPSSGV